MKKIGNVDSQLCAFGSAFYEMRAKSGITEAELCEKCKISTSHYFYILKGITQPSIEVAVRLVLAINIDTIAFFRDLAISENIFTPKNLNFTHNENKFDLFIEKIMANESITPKNLFGLLFKEIRTHYKVTQKQVAEKSGYAIRNIQKVENEEQNPSVMNALAMICAIAQETEMDIEIFFKPYLALYMKIYKYPC